MFIGACSLFAVLWWLVCGFALTAREICMVARSNPRISTQICYSWIGYTMLLPGVLRCGDGVARVT